MSKKEESFKYLGRIILLIFIISLFKYILINVLVSNVFLNIQSLIYISWGVYFLILICSLYFLFLQLKHDNVRATYWLKMGIITLMIGVLLLLLETVLPFLILLSIDTLPVFLVNIFYKLRSYIYFITWFPIGIQFLSLMMWFLIGSLLGLIISKLKS